MEIYRRELKKKGANWKDRFLIFCNTFSNNNGQSWVRGVLFTFSFAALFAIALNYLRIESSERLVFCGCRCLNWESIGLMFERFFAVVDIFDFDNKALKLSSWGNVIFFISKIFIGYGIYQTIAAFRKYGK